MFGQRLRELRQQRGWSQAELAEVAGVGQAYISELERGGRTNPSREVIQCLAQALEVSVTELAEAAWRNAPRAEAPRAASNSVAEELVRFETFWAQLSPYDRTTLLRVALTLTQVWANLSSRDRATILRLLLALGREMPTGQEST